MERRELSAADIYCKFAAQLDEDGFRLYHAAQRITGFQPYDAFPYTKRLLSAIAESGLDVRAMPAVFLGGGAALLKRHVSVADGLCRPVILDDISMNAKGYEWLTERLEQKHEQ